MSHPPPSRKQRKVYCRIHARTTVRVVNEGAAVLPSFQGACWPLNRRGGAHSVPQVCRLLWLLAGPCRCVQLPGALSEVVNSCKNTSEESTSYTAPSVRERPPSTQVILDCGGGDPSRYSAYESVNVRILGAIARRARFPTVGAEQAKAGPAPHRRRVSQRLARPLLPG